MRRTIFALAFVLGSACAAAAQDAVLAPYPAGLKISGAARLARSTGIFSSPSWASLSEPRLLAPTLAPQPAPEPPPRFVFGGRDDYRWQLATGYEFVRFRSSFYDATLSGLHTSLTYYTNDWFGLEGNTVAAFGTKPFKTISKYLLYTGGPRIVWRGHKWEPWGHVLFGGLHMIPQIAGGFSQNAFALQLGGGADYRFLPQMSARFEGDYVRSQLYAGSQSNFQFGTSVVFHF